MTNEEFKNNCDKWGYVIKNGVLAFNKGCLSNWWGAYRGQNCSIMFNEFSYGCLEQYMMHTKAHIFDGYSSEVSKMILDTENPKEQKDLGRQVKNFNPEIWNRVKYGIIYMGILEKFRFNTFEREFLLATEGLILCEAAPWDKVWGTGTGQDDERTYNPEQWIGENLLGKILMDVRESLKNQNEE